ncbi:MAG: PEGA domain-containing protein [Sedimentisphaerales bacterium]
MSSKGFAAIIVLAAVCFCTGCVERKITIITEPQGALVALNDEEIGTSPVTVGFEWYGDFAVRISKDGYQTLNTHQNLKRPLKDRFPFDLFADMFTTKIDAYTWNFKLEPSVAVQKDELIKSAAGLRKEALVDPNGEFSMKTKAKKPKHPAKHKAK